MQCVECRAWGRKLLRLRPDFWITSSPALLCSPRLSSVLLCSPLLSFAFLCSPLLASASFCSPLLASALLCLPLLSSALLCSPLLSCEEAVAPASAGVPPPRAELDTGGPQPVAAAPEADFRFLISDYRLLSDFRLLIPDFRLLISERAFPNWHFPTGISSM